MGLDDMIPFELVLEFGAGWDDDDVVVVVVVVVDDEEDEVVVGVEEEDDCAVLGVGCMGMVRGRSCTKRLGR